jgi:hypothetical protein
MKKASLQLDVAQAQEHVHRHFEVG